jgi:hypothetical protein
MSAVEAYHAFGVRLRIIPKGIPATARSLDLIGRRLATLSRIEAVKRAPGWIDEDPPVWPSFGFTVRRRVFDWAIDVFPDDPPIPNNYDARRAWCYLRPPREVTQP